MRLNIPFTTLRNAISDIWRMHDFNYQLPKDQRQNYWEKECKVHPTSSQQNSAGWNLISKSTAIGLWTTS